MATHLLNTSSSAFQQNSQQFYLWTLDQVAGYLGVSLERCKYLVKQQSFPFPVTIIGEEGNKERRWNSVEVRYWLKNLQVREIA